MVFSFFLRSMLLPSGTWKCNLQYVFEARIFHTFLLWTAGKLKLTTKKRFWRLFLMSGDASAKTLKWNTFSACLTAVIFDIATELYIFISSVAMSLTKAFLMTLYIQTTTLYHWMVLPLTNKVLLRLTCVYLLLTKSFTNHLHKILSASGLLNGRMMFISS